jgi:hypothetical protein
MTESAFEDDDSGATSSSQKGRGASGRVASSLGNRLGRLFLLAWVPGTICGLAALMLNHFVSMPNPDDLERLRKGVLGFTQGDHGFRLVHVIYQDCSCTNNLFTHLMDRGAFPEAEETILFIGKDNERRLKAARAGFRFREISSATLTEQLGVEAAPLLIVLSNDGGRLAYIGGYYDEPATIRALDEAVFASVEGGATPDPLPLYGCAVSERLQSAIDPLGLRGLK